MGGERGEVRWGHLTCTARSLWLRLYITLFPSGSGTITPPEVPPTFTLSWEELGEPI